MCFDYVNTVWNKPNSNIFKKPNTFSTEQVIWDFHKVKNTERFELQILLQWTLLLVSFLRYE